MTGEYITIAEPAYKSVQSSFRGNESTTYAVRKLLTITLININDHPHCLSLSLPFLTFTLPYQLPWSISLLWYCLKGKASTIIAGHCDFTTLLVKVKGPLNLHLINIIHHGIV